jgi:hypothetical protein
MSEELQNTVGEIIAVARDKYTVHECNECTWRKCCELKFDSAECRENREDIFLSLGIEDGYFSDLLNRIEAAWKRERTGNAAKAREALVRVLRLANVTADGENWDWNNAIAENVVKIVKEALAAPARNCDKYTGEDINRDVADAYVSADSALMLDYDCEELPIRWLLSTPEQVNEYFKHQDEENGNMWRCIAYRRNQKQEAPAEKGGAE